jgi:hypothetical protein
MFLQLHHRLRETGSLRPRQVGGGRRYVRTPEYQEEALERIANEPSTSKHAVAHAIGTSQSVCQVLRDTHTISRRCRNQGRATSHRLFSLSSGFCNEVSLILPFPRTSSLLAVYTCLHDNLQTGTHNSSTARRKIRVA